MIGMLTGRAGICLAGAVLLLAVVASIYWMGGNRAQMAQELDACRASIKAWERVQDADVSRGDPAADLDWLRDRAAGQR